MRYIENYKGKYSITKDGKIWSHIRDRFLKKQTNRLGYEIIRLGSNGQKKTLTVHRLVALTYLPKVEGCNEVNHKDGNKLNNDFSNLEWTTRSENMKHAIKTGLKVLKTELEHPMCKLSNKQIAEIRKKDTGEYGILSKIAKEYRVSVSLIHLITRKQYRI
jgi:hypothetical protein